MDFGLPIPLPGLVRLPENNFIDDRREGDDDRRSSVGQLDKGFGAARAMNPLMNITAFNIQNCYIADGIRRYSQPGLAALCRTIFVAMNG